MYNWLHHSRRALQFQRSLCFFFFTIKFIIQYFATRASFEKILGAINIEPALSVFISGRLLRAPLIYSINLTINNRAILGSSLSRVLFSQAGVSVFSRSLSWLRAYRGPQMRRNAFKMYWTVTGRRFFRIFTFFIARTGLGRLLLPLSVLVKGNALMLRGLHYVCGALRYITYIAVRVYIYPPPVL